MHLVKMITAVTINSKTYMFNKDLNSIERSNLYFAMQHKEWARDQLECERIELLD